MLENRNVLAVEGKYAKKKVSPKPLAGYGSGDELWCRAENPLLI